MAEKLKQTEKSRQAEKSRQGEKSRHEYKLKHWTSNCAHTDKKIEKCEKQIIIVPLTENSRHWYSIKHGRQ